MAWSKPKIALAAGVGVVACVAVAAAAFFFAPSDAPQVASVAYLDEEPAALGTHFDAALGAPRVVLLASPA